MVSDERKRDIAVRSSSSLVFSQVRKWISLERRLLRHLLRHFSDEDSEGFERHFGAF
jgi:hypothetical protein